ncbi:hypothetical protein D3C72_2295480 [compost metagenome]
MADGFRQVLDLLEGRLPFFDGIKNGGSLGLGDDEGLPEAEQRVERAGETLHLIG